LACLCASQGLFCFPRLVPLVRGHICSVPFRPSVIAAHGSAGEWVLVENAYTYTHARARDPTLASGRTHTRALPFTDGRTRTPPLAGGRAEQIPSIPPRRCRCLSLRSLQAGSTRYLLAAHHPTYGVSSVAGCSICASPSASDIAENPRTSHHRCYRPLFALCSLPPPPPDPRLPSPAPKTCLPFVLCHRRLLLLHDSTYAPATPTTPSTSFVNFAPSTPFEPLHLICLPPLGPCLAGGPVTRAREGKGGVVAAPSKFKALHALCFR
jgi:hypothetical protein